MAIPAASGTQRDILEAARTLLASSSTFQSLVSATGEDAAELLADALTYVYTDVIPPKTGGEDGEFIDLPFARVTFPIPPRQVELAHGTSTNSGTIMVEIMAESPDDYTTDVERERWMLNVAGSIRDEMMIAMRLGGLYCREISVHHPSRSERGSLVPFWNGELEIAWGFES